MLIINSLSFSLKLSMVIFLCASTVFSFPVRAYASFKTGSPDTGKTATSTPSPSPASDPLTLSGSVDTYYKYDFSGKPNIPTSFANEQKSVSIGMIDLALKKKVDKAAFVGEISFGPRGQLQSIPNGATGLAVVKSADGTTSTGTAYSSYHIQNLYVTYDVTEKLTLAGGYMVTFLGYEVTSPLGNFNYSTSYLFTNSAFENAGFKATYVFTDKVSLMAGIFNDYWNVYQSGGRVNTFGAQLTVTPVKNWTAYINVLSGPQSGTELDLTTAWQFTPVFKLGLNASDFSISNSLTGGFAGVAVYPQLTISKTVTLGLRGEYFKTKTGIYLVSGPLPGESVTGLTATANIKLGPLTLIPEFRMDNSSKNDLFINSSSAYVTSASQFVFAAVYAL